MYKKGVFLMLMVKKTSRKRSNYKDIINYV